MVVFVKFFFQFHFCFDFFQAGRYNQKSSKNFFTSHLRSKSCPCWPKRNFWDFYLFISSTKLNTIYVTTLEFFGIRRFASQRGFHVSFWKLSVNSVPNIFKHLLKSCNDLAYFFIFPLTLERLEKILFILSLHKPPEFFDRNLGQSFIKSVKEINDFQNDHYFYLQYCDWKIIPGWFQARFSRISWKIWKTSELKISLNFI